MLDEILTAREVAKLLKCSMSKVYELNIPGQLPASYKIFDGEKGLRWLLSDVKAYLYEHQLPEREPAETNQPFVAVGPLKEEAI